MIRNVTLAELTEHLAEHFESVRQGTTLRVMEGDETLATILPGEEPSTEITDPREPPKTYSIPGMKRPKGSPGLVLARPADTTMPLGSWRPEPLDYELDFDPVEELLKDREQGR
jgi:antitoxin (DNA-binding transcriptional repressor) of toxin-antitoxin stability system